MEVNLKRNLLACYLSDIVLGTFFQLPIWIVYQSSFLSYTQIAFYSGLSLITEVLAQLPTGAFADMFGRKYALSLGNLFMALPMFLIALYPSPSIMPLYAIMWGLGRAFCMGTSRPIVYDTLLQSNQTSLYPKIVSHSLVFFQFSAAISIALGGYLYQIMPNLPYLFSGIASMVGVVVAFLFIEPSRKADNHTLQKFVLTAKSGFLEITKNSYLIKLTVLYTLSLGIAQTSQQFFAQPYMLELGMSDIARSWAAMLIKITIALVGAKAIATSKIIQHRFYLLIIPILMIFSYTPASIVDLPLAYLVLIGIAFNSGNTELFLSGEINDHIRSHVRSTAVSIQRMFASAFGALVQWLSIAIVGNSSIGTYYTYLGIFSLIIILPLAYNLAQHKHSVKLDPLLALKA